MLKANNHLTFHAVPWGRQRASVYSQIEITLNLSWNGSQGNPNLGGLSFSHLSSFNPLMILMEISSCGVHHFHFQIKHRFGSKDTYQLSYSMNQQIKPLDEES